MSVERIMVNDHELTAFDLPPEPSETYTVNVDGLGEIVVEKGKPPKEKDVPAMYMRKLVPELCEQNAELYRENAKLRELVEILCFCMQIHKQCDDCKLNGAKGELVHDPLCACDGLHEILRELGIEVG